MSEDFFAAADGPKRQPGLQLAWRNRRILAKRLHWPDGALEACEQLDRDHPRWSTSYLQKNTIRGFERPAGFYAWRLGLDGGHQVPAYGATAVELGKVLARMGHR